MILFCIDWNKTMETLKLSCYEMEPGVAQHLIGALKFNKVILCGYYHDIIIRLSLSFYRSSQTFISFEMAFEPMQDEDWKYFEDFLVTNEVRFLFGRVMIIYILFLKKDTHFTGTSRS